MSDQDEPLQDPPDGACPRTMASPSTATGSVPRSLRSGPGRTAVMPVVAPETVPGGPQSLQYSLAPEHLQGLE